MFHLKTPQFVPGIALCSTVSAAAIASERLEVKLFGRILVRGADAGDPAWRRDAHALSPG